MAERPQVTRTTHILPFERLSPLDFERLCLWLVRREGHEGAEHLGAAGSEQGRDIVAWRDGRRVVFQCKRVDRLDPSGAEKEIEKLRSLPAEDQPDDFVFVVSTAVSVTTRDRALAAWGDQGSCDFWAGSELDERVKRHADILHEFFDLGAEGRTVTDPLLRLPAPPAMDLPPSPFKHLHWFEREDAEVFFGRGQEIRDLYDAVTLPDEVPIVLLFGATGVGKSSLLAAGLLPRLEAKHDVKYVRRDGNRGLAATLADAVGGDLALTDPGAWRASEENGSPLVVILDQVEEAWTRPIAGDVGEIESFAAVLRAQFSSRDHRPRGRLVLSFRKEWLAEVLGILEAEKLPLSRVEIRHLSPTGIAEAVEGPTVNKRLRGHYGLTVDAEVVSKVVADLAEASRADDNGSPEPAQVAPVLQILLTKMWAEARKLNLAAPHFTLGLYQRLKNRGILLDDFLGDTLTELRAWRPEVEGSGLALDFLAHHTTSLGTAETRQAAEVLQRYGDRGDIAELLQKCKDQYLLIGSARCKDGELLAVGDDPEDKGATRLAHDTLAPLVRRRFESSDLPGPRAQRILLERAVAWTGGRAGPVLDRIDLASVEEGESGMRTFTKDEERLLQTSRQERELRARRQRTRHRTAVAAVVVIGALAAVATFLWRRAIESQQQAQERARVAIASGLLENDPTRANVLLLEVERAEAMPPAMIALHRALEKPLMTALLGSGPELDFPFSFSSDGAKLVSGMMDEEGDAKGLTVWDTLSGEELLRLEQEHVSGASFNPTRPQILATYEYGTIRLFDATSGHQILPFQVALTDIEHAWFSPDGKYILALSKNDAAHIVDSQSGRELSSFEMPVERNEYGDLGLRFFIPVHVDNYRVLAKTADGAARLWDVTSGQEIVFRKSSEEVTALTLTENSARVLTESTDGGIRIRDIPSGRVLARGGAKVAGGKIEFARFSPDGRRVGVVVEDGSVYILDTVMGSPHGTNSSGEFYADIITLSGRHNDSKLLFSHDGGHVIIIDGEGRNSSIWGAETGQLSATIPGVFMALSADGTRAAVLLSMDGKEAKKTFQSQVWQIALGAELTTLENKICSWCDEVSGSVLASPEETAVSPNGRWTASQDPTDFFIQIQDAGSGKPLGKLLGSNPSFSFDSRRVVTTAPDLTAKIWEVDTGRQLAVLRGHEGPILTASFSPNGAWVVTASMDRSARLWDSKSGLLIATWRHEAELEVAAFSPDGSRVITFSRASFNDLDLNAAPQVVHEPSPAEAVAVPFPVASVATTEKDPEIGTRRQEPVDIPESILLPSPASSPQETVPDESFEDGPLIRRIWAVSPEILKALILSRTNVCLDPDFRMWTLGESRREAWMKFEPCEVCQGRCATVEMREQWRDESPEKALRGYQSCLSRLERRPAKNPFGITLEESWRGWQECVAQN